ncbi:MAG: WYL domain-containing protein [Elusimicrobia bacterium]|nr:WYL domain-containing protein [Elusimicrobiota bacterium]
MFNDISGKVKRLMYIANELDNGEIKVSSIALDLGVSVRTIQRDIQTLESGGFAISPLSRGTYSFVDGFSLKKLKITCEEFAMLAVFSEIANALGEKFSNSYSSLKNKVLEHNKVTESPFFIKMLKGREYKDTEITRNIETAIECSYKIKVEYKTAKEEENINNVPVKPLKILWFDGFWYLLALGYKNRLLKLRLEKITSCKVMEQTFTKPKNLQNILNESVNIWFETKRDKKAVLNIDKKVSKYFKEKNYFPKQKIVKEYKTGDIVLECYFAKEEEILHTILQWIPYIVVKEPQSLIDSIKTRIEDYRKLLK